MQEEAPKAEFTDVDRASDSQWHVNCLKEQHASGSLEKEKQRTLQILDIQVGAQVLDAGCGTGVNALAMAALVGAGGHVTGIDFSEQMVIAAREQSRASKLPVSSYQGDIYHLSFADSSFDRCRSDKTFQHLRNPRRALQELIRVTKPGGKIVIADPDHESLVIHTPYKEINRRFVQFRSDAFQQGGIAHELYGLFKEFGLENVSAEPITTVYTDYEVRKITSPYLKEIWVAHNYGIVTREEVDQWSSYLRAAIDTDRFFCMQSYIINSGTKPA